MTQELTEYEPVRVRVGVGVIVLRDGLVLLGKRSGSHGAGTWALPGGHLEFGEAVEECARREVREETGLELIDVVPAPYTNDLMLDQLLHYVTCFVQATAKPGEPRRLEPKKCLEWAWYRWSDLPEPLLQPLRTLVAQGFIPAGAA